MYLVDNCVNIDLVYQTITFSVVKCNSGFLDIKMMLMLALKIASLTEHLYFPGIFTVCLDSSILAFTALHVKLLGDAKPCTS